MCSSIAIDNGIVERRKSSGHNVIKCDKGFVWSHLLKNFMLHVLMDNGYPASLAVLKTNRYGESMHTISYHCGCQWLYCKQHKVLH